MKQILIFLNLIFISIVLFSKDIPVPLNNFLFTEFTFERTSPFLKKPVVGNGLIVMNGKDHFIFKQIKPVLLKIEKSSDGVIYQKGDNKPVKIVALSDNFENGNIAILFSGDNERISEIFDINYQVSENNDLFTLKPKNNALELKTIDEIIIKSNDDIIEMIKISYKNKSTILYLFQNTVTGIKPNEESYK